MATTLSLLFPTTQSHHTSHSHSHYKPRLNPYPNPKFQSSSFSLSKFNPSLLSSTSFSTSHFPPPSASYNTQFSPKAGVFLTNQELKRLQFLDNFSYSCNLASGYLVIRVMKDSELDTTVGLLAESFSESMMLPAMYLTVLGFLIKQYLVERRSLMPHAATLVGYYKDELGDEELVGTVEMSFDKRGANSSPPTPTPPKHCPYICNMTVKNSHRRKGIGWHLLKASEELISTMGLSRNVYLHCRMIDSIPLNMYKKANYDIVATDSFLTLLTLQRRKHLMCKQLPASSELDEVFSFEDEEKPFSSVDMRESEPSSSDEVVQESFDVAK